MSLSSIKAFDPTATAEVVIPSAPVIPAAPAPGSPTPLTLEQVFGVKSQMTVLGYTPGHSLAPVKNPLYVWESSRVKDIMEWLALDSPDPLWISGPTGSDEPPRPTLRKLRLEVGVSCPYAA